MKKAQNLIEVSLVLVLVVVVSLALWPMFNNQKTKLADISKTRLVTQSISARQIQLSNNAFDLASDMGLTINRNENPTNILNQINTRLGELNASAGADTKSQSEISDYTRRYHELSNEMSSINSSAVTISDNTTVAGAQGGRVSSTSVVPSSTTTISTNSSVTSTRVTGHYAEQVNTGRGAVTTGVSADSGIEESQYAIHTQP